MNAGVPVVPGSDGLVATAEEAKHTLQKELVIRYLLKRQLEAVEKECARHSAEKI